LNPNDLSPREIRELPREVGVMLVSVGLMGFVLPGMAGAPALVAGGLVLWPGVFGKLEDRLKRRYPQLHRQGLRQIGRYLDDLERRSPDPEGSATR
jgi:hypothetical protein